MAEDAVMAGDQIGRLVFQTLAKGRVIYAIEKAPVLFMNRGFCNYPHLRF